MTSQNTIADLKAAYIPRYHAIVLSTEDSHKLGRLYRQMYEEFVTDTRLLFPTFAAQRILDLWSEVLAEATSAPESRQHAA